MTSGDVISEESRLVLTWKWSWQVGGAGRAVREPRVGGARGGGGRAGAAEERAPPSGGPQRGPADDAAPGQRRAGAAKARRQPRLGLDHPVRALSQPTQPPTAPPQSVVDGLVTSTSVPV